MRMENAGQQRNDFVVLEAKENAVSFSGTSCFTFNSDALAVYCRPTFGFIFKPPGFVLLVEKTISHLYHIYIA